MRVVLATCAVLLIAATAAAATISVPHQQPTIQAAVTAAAAGDTIVVSKGVYPENVVVPSGKDGIVIRGSGAVLDGNLNGTQGICLSVASSNVVVTGMTFRNGTDQIVTTGAGLRVAKCSFFESSGFGVNATADNVVVEGCRFQGTSNSAFKVTGASAVLRKCTLRHCGNGGLDATGLGAVADSNTFVWIDDSNAIKVTGDGCQALKNKFSLCDRDCIRITGITSVVDGNKAERVSARLANITTGSNAIVRNNKATLVVGGVLVSGDNVQVLSNRISQCSTSAGISVTGDNVAVSSNTVTTTWNDADGVFVDSSSTTGGGTVEGNKVTDAAGYGFRLDTVYNLVVRSNTATRCADDNRDGFRLVGNANTVERCSTTDSDNVGFYVDGNSNTLTACSTSRATEVGFLIAGGTSNTLTDCTAASCALEGLDNQALLTSVVRGRFHGDRFDIANDVSGASTFADPTLDGVKFTTGGALQQSQF